MIDFETAYQLFLVVFLGALIGLERESKKKAAGVQTYSLVALGSCFFTILSFEMVRVFFKNSDVIFDPLRAVQSVAIGIGFIGAGAIFSQKGKIVGLTTAAGLWVVAAIGMAVGVRLYFLSTVVTFLTLLIFSGLGWVELKIFGNEK